MWDKGKGTRKYSSITPRTKMKEKQKVDK